MKLSIIVPIYQVEDYLAACLDSIIAQTRGDFECLLIDDGSTDNSNAIAREYVAKDQRFRLIRQDNAGLGPARNTGIDAAKGEYLMFVDSDDVLSPRAVQMLVDSLETTGSDIAVGNVRRFGSPNGVVQSWTHAEPCSENLTATRISEYMSLYRDRMVWNKVYRRSFWDKHEFRFPAIRYEDYPVTLPAHILANRVDVFSDPVYFWRDRVTKNSITQRAKDVDNAMDRIASANLVLDFIDDKCRREKEQWLYDVRYWVRRHFIEVDVVAVAEAIASSDDQHRSDLLLAAQLFVQRVKKSRRPNGIEVGDNFLDAIESGDLVFMRSLIAQRAGDRLAVVKQLKQRPTVCALVYLRNRFWWWQNHRWPKIWRRPRSAEVVDLTVADGRAEITLNAKVSPKLRRFVGYSAFLRNNYRTFQLPISGSSNRLHLSVPAEPLQKDHRFWQQLDLEVKLRLGPFLAVGPARFTGGGEVYDFGENHWLGDLDGNGTVGVDFGDFASLTVEWCGEALTLTSPDGDPVLHRPAPSTDLPGSGGRLEISADELGADTDDDPISGLTSRAITVDNRPTRLASKPVSQTIDGIEYTVQRSGPTTVTLTRQFTKIKEI